MKKICGVLFLATASFFTQSACSSGNQTSSTTNTSVNTAARNQAPNTNASSNANPNQAASTQSSNTSSSNDPFPELMMVYSGQFFTPRMKNDRAKVESILSDEYKETTGDGRVLSKAQVLASLTPDKKFDTYTLDELKSTTTGETGAVTGSVCVTIQGKMESWRFNTAFKKQQGRWQAVSTKITDYKKSCPPASPLGAATN